MCGIAGYMGPRRVDLNEVGNRLCAALKHRGPDGEGRKEFLFEDSGRCLLLVHRRLAILDLSSNGNQPMCDRATGNWMIYNGETYNFRDLRREMKLQGVEFTSESDTEVVLKAYGQKGASFLNDLCGMYALAIYDCRKQHLVLAVDPQGIKPLYYYQGEDGSFLFASELRALLETGLVPRRIDPMALESYLSYGAVQAPNTMIAGIKALLPAECLIVTQSGKMQGPTRYWTAPYSSVCENDKAAAFNAKTMRTLLDAAVKQHLISDAPLGIFLSGGIDSSSILASASQSAVGLKTFSITFQESQFSESKFSLGMAKRFKTYHTEICLAEEDLLRELPDAMAAMDQPSIDGINVFAISKVVRAAGVKVVLSGQGGDELFAGYPTFKYVRLAKTLRSLLPLPVSSYKALGQIFAFARERQKAIPGKVAQYLAGDGDLIRSYFLARQLFPMATRRSLFPAGGEGCTPEGLPEDLFTSLWRESNHLDPVNLVSLLEMRTYLANMLLRDGDVMSMAHGLEVRVPFLDRRLCDSMARVPGDRKTRGGKPKPLLLEMMEGSLPREIWARPKQGFTFPWELWLRARLFRMVDMALNDSSLFLKLGFASNQVVELWKAFQRRAPGLRWSRIWALVVLHHWAQANRASL